MSTAECVECKKSLSKISFLSYICAIAANRTKMNIIDLGYIGVNGTKGYISKYNQ